MTGLPIKKMQFLKKNRFFFSKKLFLYTIYAIISADAIRFYSKNKGRGP